MQAPSYTTNVEDAKQGSGFESNRITEPGLYFGTITQAEYITSSSSPSTGIQLNFKSDDGKTANYLSLWTHGKDGAPTYGHKQLSALLVCLGLKDIQPIDGMATHWDSATKSEIQEPAILYPGMCNRPVGLILQKELYTDRNGQDKDRLLFFAPVKHGTQQTAAEAIENKPAQTVQKMVQSLSVKDSRRSGGYSPQQQSTDTSVYDEWMAEGQ